MVSLDKIESSQKAFLTFLSTIVGQNHPRWMQGIAWIIMFAKLFRYHRSNACADPVREIAQVMCLFCAVSTLLVMCIVTLATNARIDAFRVIGPRYLWCFASGIVAVWLWILVRGTNGHYATRIGSLDCLRSWCQLHGTVDASTILGETLLHAAVKHQRGEIVRYLLETGCNRRRRNIYRQTPLDIAKKRNYSSIIAMLDERSIGLEPVSKHWG
jgi:hypothetical protein